MLNKEEIEYKIKPIGERLQDKIYTLKKENFEQSQYIDQLESDKQKLIEKLEEDKMEQFDDYVIYLIESYLEIVKGVENERDKI